MYDLCHIFDSIKNKHEGYDTFFLKLSEVDNCSVHNYTYMKNDLALEENNQGCT